MEPQKQFRSSNSNEQREDLRNLKIFILEKKLLDKLSKNKDLSF